MAYFPNKNTYFYWGNKPLLISITFLQIFCACFLQNNFASNGKFIRSIKSRAYIFTVAFQTHTGCSFALLFHNFTIANQRYVEFVRFEFIQFCIILILTISNTLKQWKKRCMKFGKFSRR